MQSRFYCNADMAAVLGLSTGTDVMLLCCPWVTSARQIHEASCWVMLGLNYRLLQLPQLGEPCFSHTGLLKAQRLDPTKLSQSWH